MTGHNQTYAPFELEGLTQEDIQAFLDSLPPTEAGIEGLFTLDNVPGADEAGIDGVFTLNNSPGYVEEFDCGPDCTIFQEQVYEWDGTVPDSETIVIGDVEVTNTEDNSWEASAFGIELNDRDDFFTVGIVLVVAAVLYIGKCSIDYWFACALERYKNNKLK
jgi:hypothetical protein